MTVQSKPVTIEAPSKSLPAAALEWYVGQLTTNPLRTKAITSGVLSGLQEYVAQNLSGSREKGKSKQSTIFDDPNNQKVVKMALYGFLISGPLGHLLFQVLDRVFKNRSGLGAKILQLLASNLIITPIQNAVYLAAMAVIGGVQTPGKIYVAVTGSFWPLMKISWIVSPVAIAFAQRFLPPQLWVPFFNLVGFVFGVVANTKAKRVQQRKYRDRGTQQQEK